MENLPNVGSYLILVAQTNKPIPSHYTYAVKLTCQNMKRLFDCRQRYCLGENNTTRFYCIYNEVVYFRPKVL